MTSIRLNELLAIEEDWQFPKRSGIDFYHTYKDDLALMKQLGLKSLPYFDQLGADLSQRRRCAA